MVYDPLLFQEMQAAEEAAATDGASGGSSLSVVLGLLAVAAVGVGIYMGWRHYKQ